MMPQALKSLIVFAVLFACLAAAAEAQIRPQFGDQFNNQPNYQSNNQYSDPEPLPGPAAPPQNNPTPIEVELDGPAGLPPAEGPAPEVIDDFVPPPLPETVSDSDVQSYWYPTDWIYYPTGGWGFDTDPWDVSAELGINGSEGNAQSLGIKAGFSSVRKTKHTKTEFKINYARTEANSELTQHNLLTTARWEWLFKESPYTIFFKNDNEYDQFKAFDLRVVFNGGIGYRFIDTEDLQLSGRFGSGFSHEIGGPDKEIVPEAVFGLDYTHKISKKQKLTFGTEYFPAWDNFQDFRLVSNLSWEVILDEETNLSMKVGVIDRYDSTPQGRKPNDIDYSLLLLWKPF